ncbi:MAG: DNA mismatch repair endonuclease MutL [Amoebophilaceae bacterium]|jgi:DNA mismatch repair protein MutL|nr:DNA mismatch repair endonuclease MutL [Amoebophilaceae bacterium]
MSNLIRLLPDALANQIAAGEVVQRPASVVKELLENAVDAGSTAIKVIVKDAGKSLIQVIDNGTGMSEVDARLSFERHATSKIRTAADLFNIQTMGFRGEALASIAAVAQLEMETCHKKGSLGTRIIIEGAQFKTQAPVSTPQGTKVSVKNLFFNVPARRNFLKSNPVETKHLIDEFQRVALARHDIAFSFYQNSLETYLLPAAKLSHRIVHVLGEASKKQLIPCQEETEVLKIQGYIGKPEYAKKTRGDQFFFVNQRFIKSLYLHHAVKTAFEGLLSPNTFPFYVLFIEIAPDRIDVNVHPTKTEIKFDDERMVYSILTAAIKRALATHHMTPSIDFEQNNNFNPFSTTSSTTTSTAEKVKESRYAQFKSWDTMPQQGKIKDWERLFQPLDKHPDNTTITWQMAGASSTPTASETASLQPTHATANTVKVQLHNKYILTQLKSGILLIDQHAAHERILYEQYLQPLLHNKGKSAQQLLFPVRIHLNPADLALVQAHATDMHALGFVLDTFERDSLIVTGCPVEAADHDLKQLLEGLVEQFKWNQARFTLTTQENLARSLAKRACIQSGKKLQQEEIDALVDQLFACTHPHHTPAGHKTFVVMTLEAIDTIFQE